MSLLNVFIQSVKHNKAVVAVGTAVIGYSVYAYRKAVTDEAPAAATEPAAKTEAPAEAAAASA